VGIAHRRSSRSASQRQWADDSIRDPRTTGRVGQTNLLSGPIVHYECQSAALSLRHRCRPVLVRAVAASMASGEVTRPVAASRPAMQGPSQDHRALVVGRARGAISLVLHHRQPPAQRAARSRRWSTTSPRPVGRPCDIGNQLIQPDTEHGTHSTHLCCSEYVNNAPSLNPLESCRAIPLGIRLPPAAIHRKPFSNGFPVSSTIPADNGVSDNCRRRGARCRAGGSTPSTVSLLASDP
jgi:hypothetical protein